MSLYSIRTRIMSWKATAFLFQYRGSRLPSSSAQLLGLTREHLVFHQVAGHYLSEHCLEHLPSLSTRWRGRLLIRSCAALWKEAPPPGLRLPGKPNQVLPRSRPLSPFRTSWCLCCPVQTMEWDSWWPCCLNPVQPITEFTMLLGI